MNGPEALSRAEAIVLLGTREVGRLVYTRRALPAVMVVSYAVRDGAVWAWTGSASSLARALRGAVVAFQVDDLDLAARSGWSVLVTGLSETVTDAAQVARARTEGPVPWSPGFRGTLVRIPLTIVSGRRFGADRETGRGGAPAGPVEPEPAARPRRPRGQAAARPAVRWPARGPDR